MISKIKLLSELHFLLYSFTSFNALLLEYYFTSHS